MPSEYSITYTYNDGHVHGMSDTSTIESTDSHWTKSGETTRKIGQITRIVCTRRYSTNRYSGAMTAHNELMLSDGSTIVSEDCKAYPDPNVTFTFNWRSLSLKDTQISKWILKTVVTAGKPSDLYWRATNGCPVVLTFYFYDWNDMVGNSRIPTMSSADISISGGSSGVYLRGQSNISISVVAHIDSSYASQLVNTYTLKLTQNGSQIYSNSKAITGSGTATFSVGKINTIGAVTVNASMRDNVGRTVSASTTFSVTEYNQAQITCPAGTNGADRCKKVQDEYGSSNDYVIASDGTMVMINIDARVSNVGGQSNSGDLTVKWGRGSTPGTSQISSKSLGTVTPTSPKSIRNDYKSITGAFDTAQDYWVRFELKDKFGALVTRDAYLNKVESIFNIEPNGVAVGQLSTGTSSNKKFECAYPAYFTSGATITNPTFKGTITGISTSTTYKLGEVDTGDKWIDGKAIYRFIWSGTTTLVGAQGTVCSLPSIPDTIVWSGGMVKREDDIWGTVPNTWYQTYGNWEINIKITPSTRTVEMGFGKSLTGTKSVIFYCLYTK